MSRPAVHPLGRLDRRMIFLIIALSVAIPMAFHFKLPARPSPIVKRIYDKVESLPEGSRVLISFDYSPSTVPENRPMSYAVLRHCLARNLKVYLLTIWATGPDMINRAIEEVIDKDFPDKVYGRDWVNMGYKSGNQGVINSIVANFGTLFTADQAGTPLDQIELTKDIRTLADFDLIVCIGAGYPGVKEWVQFGGDPARVPVAGGVTAVEAPLLYPYYPKQLLGLMGGLQGAAEYEAALVQGYPQYKATSEVAISKMGPQTVAHLVILAFIALGNAAYFLGRKGGRG